MIYAAYLRERHLERVGRVSLSVCKEIASLLMPNVRGHHEAGQFYRIFRGFI